MYYDSTISKDKEQLSDVLYFAYFNYSHPIWGFTFAKIITSLDTWPA